MPKISPWKIDALRSSLIAVALPAAATIAAPITAVVAGTAVLALFTGLTYAQHKEQNKSDQQIHDLILGSLKNQNINHDQLLEKLNELPQSILNGIDTSTIADRLQILNEINRKINFNQYSLAEINENTEQIDENIKTILADHKDFVIHIEQSMADHFNEMRGYLTELKLDTAAIKSDLKHLIEVTENTNDIVRKILENQEGKHDQELADRDKTIQELRDAIQLLKEAAASGDTEAELALNEARRTGDSARIQEVLIRISDEQFKQDQSHYIKRCREIAAIAYLRGDIDEAEKRIKIILSTLPDDLDAINRMGWIHRLLGRLDNAESCYNRLIKLQPNDKLCLAIAYGNLGVIYQTRGWLDEAEEMYHKALDINKQLGRKEGMAIQYGNLGLLEKQRGDTDEARKLWTTARNLFSEIPMPHMVKRVQGLIDAL